MLGEHVAGERRRDLLLAIERHVHGEVHRHHPRDLAHVVVDRVAFSNAPRRQRMADVMHVVQRHHRLAARPDPAPPSSGRR